jgi:tRNA-Thr(GGU) m(6)t(6)A37 methyltransferase TsaA
MVFKLVVATTIVKTIITQAFPPIDGVPVADENARVFTLRPIGIIRSPYHDTNEIPRGPDTRHEAEGTLELNPELEPGLQDIEGFSHLYVLWIFDRAEPGDLIAHPPIDDRPHGVFATRSPRRPNPIGLTVVELLDRDGPALRVRGIDMLEGTPILDIKPYLSNVPPERLRRGWLAEAEARTRAKP